MIFKYTIRNGKKTESLIASTNFLVSDTTIGIITDLGESRVSTYNNSNGKLCFKIGGQVINFLSFDKISIREVKDKFKQTGLIDSNELMLAIICDGWRNVRFKVNGLDLSENLGEGLEEGLGENYDENYGENEYLFLDPANPYNIHRCEEISLYRSNYKQESADRRERIAVDRLIQLIQTGFIEFVDSKYTGIEPEYNCREYFYHATKNLKHGVKLI